MNCLSWESPGRTSTRHKPPARPLSEAAGNAPQHHQERPTNANRVPPVWAALVNATAGVALEMDEGNRLGGGHPSIHVTPPALAVAEDSGCRGPELLAAVIAGYEVTSRIGAATQVRAEVHSHGTWGTTGTTVNMLPVDALRIPGIILPPVQIVTAFTAVAETTRSRQEELIDESRALAAQRDALQPLLVSGKLCVTPHSARLAEEIGS